MSMLDAFLDGFTGAGLFAKLRWPGAPTEFIDSRTAREFNARSAASDFFLGHMLRKLKVQSVSVESALLHILSLLLASGAITSERLQAMASAELHRVPKD